MGRKDQEYEVESIIGKRRKRNSGSVEYRVMWKGWSRDNATWEPEENLNGVKSMVDEFNQKLEGRSKSPITPTKSVDKKNSEETYSQNQVKKSYPQKTTRKIAKESDEENINEEEQEEQEVKPPVTTKSKVQKIIEEAPKIPEKKPPIQAKITPPVRNGVKSQINNNESLEMKRPHPVQKNLENEQIATDDDEEEQDAILEVTGMLVGENNKYEFTVIEKKLNRRLTMKRKEILKRDPVALVRFYERHINTV